RRKAEADQAQREADEAKRRAEAASLAEAIWQQSAPCGQHLYLHRKGERAHGARVSRGNLVIPVRDADGTLHSLQFVANDGIKKYLRHGRTRSCHYAIGAPGEVFCIAEGVATG